MKIKIFKKRNMILPKSIVTGVKELLAIKNLKFFRFKGIKLFILKLLKILIY